MDPLSGHSVYLRGSVEEALLGFPGQGKATHLWRDPIAFTSWTRGKIGNQPFTPGYRFLGRDRLRLARVCVLELWHPHTLPTVPLFLEKEKPLTLCFGAPRGVLLDTCEKHYCEESCSPPSSFPGLLDSSGSMSSRAEGMQDLRAPNSCR